MSRIDKPVQTDVSDETLTHDQPKPVETTAPTVRASQAASPAREEHVSMSRIIELRNLAAVSLTLAAPGTAVLFVIMWLDHLPIAHAFVAAVVNFVAVCVLLRGHQRRLSRVRERLQRFSSRDADASIALNGYAPFSLGGADLLELTQRVDRVWRQTLEVQRKSVQSSQVIVDALPDPLLLLNAETEIVSLNAAARALLGGDMAGRDLATVLRDPQILRAVNGVSLGDGFQEVEFEFSGKGDRTLNAMVCPTDSPISLDPEKNLPIVVMVLLRDVTAAKRIDAMRADFVANVSHELRTPLSSVTGFIETLRGSARDDPDASDRFLQIMHDQTARMIRLVNDLLSLSRIELNEHTPPTERVEIDALVKDVIDGLRLTAQARQITIETRIATDLPIVAGDEDELTQVFQNLVDNAIKYGRSGSAITVTVGKPGRSPISHRGHAEIMAVSVADQGEGIAEDHIPRLTERFYRIDAARSRAVGGTGLGLAIVKHIVNRHRGALTIDSTRGSGSTFTVHLPGVRSG
ncbi:MAG: ATP-binding protein [Pseudomonadota bacterium]